MTTRPDILTALRSRECRALYAQYGATSVSLFGSWARDQQRPDSDVDLLVEQTAQNLTLDGYFGLKFALEEKLGRPVDMVQDEIRKTPFWPYVEKDLISIV